ncbi:MAG: class I SAM-dependent methyltransferase [Candidatus Omnitrophica bacterium]|nr:class I SAM-dependent methyltransferase [Candidatus Omnitrophota bacterium]
MDKSIIENHERYCARIEMFKRSGYDIEKERNLILEKALPLKGSILEVGTGKGHFAIILAQKGYSFTSVDISEKEQEYAKMNIEYYGLQEKIDFRVEDAEQLSFENNSFDMIFAINMIHHLSSPYKVIDEFVRVVKGSGKIIVSDFNKKGLALVDKIHRSEGREHPTGRAAIDEVKNYLSDKEFETERCETVFQETIIAYPSQ